MLGTMRIPGKDQKDVGESLMGKKSTVLFFALITAAFISTIGDASAAAIAGSEIIGRGKPAITAVNEAPPADAQQAPRPMFCQIAGLGTNPEYCKTTAYGEGQFCLCKRRLPSGAGGATRAPGKTTLTPKGKLW